MMELSQTSSFFTDAEADSDAGANPGIHSEPNPEDSALAHTMTRLEHAAPHEVVSVQNGRLVAGGTQDIYETVQALFLDYFEPVNGILPPPLVIEMLHFRFGSVRTLWGMRVGALRALYEQARSHRFFLSKINRFRHILQDGMVSLPWLDKCWAERLPLLHQAGKWLELELAFNEMQEEGQRKFGAPISPIVQMLGGELEEIKLKDLLFTSFANWTKSTLPIETRRVDLARLFSMIRYECAKAREREFQDFWFSHWNQSMSHLYISAKGFFNHQMLAHFTPFDDLSILHRSLCLLAAHASLTSQQGVGRFVACCKTQSALTLRLNRVVPPRWLIGVLRFRHYIDNHLGTSDAEVVCTCPWSELESMTREYWTPDTAFVVDMGYHSVMIRLYSAEVKAPPSGNCNEQGNYKGVAFEQAWYYDPDRGYVQCAIDRLNTLERLLETQFFSLNDEPRFNGDFPSCTLRRVKFSPESIVEFSLNALIDWKETEP